MPCRATTKSTLRIYRRQNEPEPYFVQVIKYDGSTTGPHPKCIEGHSGAGVYQRSALGPFISAMMMDVLTEDFSRKVAREIMFADDVAICAK